MRWYEPSGPDAATAAGLMRELAAAWLEIAARVDAGTRVPASHLVAARDRVRALERACGRWWRVWRLVEEDPL